MYLDLDETLVQKAMEISGINTQNAVIDMLLNEYIKKNNQKNILKYRGTKIWEDNDVNREKINNDIQVFHKDSDFELLEKETKMKTYKKR
jgi:Arc/MetJ family transcription regulator